MGWKFAKKISDLFSTTFSLSETPSAPKYKASVHHFYSEGYSLPFFSRSARPASATSRFTNSSDKSVSAPSRLHIYCMRAVVLTTPPIWLLAPSSPMCFILEIKSSGRLSAIHPSNFSPAGAPETVKKMVGFEKNEKEGSCVSNWCFWSISVIFGAENNWKTIILYSKYNFTKT